jgi:hypothetical protein
MIVKRTESGHEFTTHTTDGAFIVTLTLTDEGEETLRTVPVGVPVSFTALKLEPGTIKMAIGPERWNNFQRMKKLGTAAMFIDRHSREFVL